MKTFYLLLCLSISFSASFAQPGELDPAFGENGVEKIMYVSKGTLIADNGINYAIETETIGEGEQAYDLVRVSKYLANGDLDLSYGTNGFTETITMVYSKSALLSDGRVVIVGITLFPPDGPYYRQTIIVTFKANGSIEKNYTTPEIGTFRTSPVKLIKQQNEPTLFLSTGIFGSAGDHITMLESGFEFQGPLVDLEYTDAWEYTSSKSIAKEGNNWIIAGIHRFEFEPELAPGLFTEEFALKKYTNGQLDASFGVNGYLVPHFAGSSYEHMLLTSDGKIIVVNTVFNESTGNNDFRIFRLNQDGSIDLTFNGTGSQITDFGGNDVPYVILLQDNKIIVAGSTQNPSTGDMEFAIVRYNENGELDTDFNEDGKQTLGEEGYSYKLEKLKIEGNRLLASGNITSNTGDTYRVTAAYLLTAGANVEITCPAAPTLPTDPGLCRAVVNNIDPLITPQGSAASVTYSITGATTKTGTGSASGKTFNKGISVVTYSLVDNPSKTCSFQVTVQDKETPVISNVSASPNSMWPPNHKMKDVFLNYTITDNCSKNIKPVISISSNEPQAGTDKDDIADDWKVIDAKHVQLRAERDGKGNGRVYTITIEAKDYSGNKTEQKVEVTVPHDNSGKKDKKTHFAVKVRPNPTTNFFTFDIRSKSDEKVSLKVMDFSGRIVETRAGISPNATLEIGSNYPRGTYSAEVRQGNKKETVIMVKL